MLVVAALGLVIVFVVTGLGVLLGSVLAGGSGAGLAQPVDDAARTWFQSQTSAVHPFASILALLCGAGAMTLWAALAGLVVWRRTRRPLLASIPLVVALAADAVVYLVKVTVARPRPALIAGAFGGRYSFPSGHATVSTAVLVAVALIWIRPERRTVALFAAGLSAALVGVSRLVLDVHWLSDVVVGVALGTLLAMGLTRVMGRWLEAERRSRSAANRTPRRRGTFR